MHAVQVSEAHVRLEVLRPVEGGADGEPPAVGVGNRAGTRVLVVDRGRFVGDAAAQRPEAVDAGVVADGVEVRVLPVLRGGEVFVLGLDRQGLEARPVGPAHGAVEAQPVIDVPGGGEHGPSGGVHGDLSVHGSRQREGTSFDRDLDFAVGIERAVDRVSDGGAVGGTDADAFNRRPHQADVPTPGVAGDLRVGHARL